MKRKIISGIFLIFIGLILGTIIYLAGLINIYLSSFIILFITFDLFRKNEKETKLKVIESYEKDKIFGTDILPYLYMENLLILGFLIPIFLATTVTQISSLIYLLTYLFFSLKRIIRMRKYLKENNYIN